MPSWPCLRGLSEQDRVSSVPRGLVRVGLEQCVVRLGLVRPVVHGDKVGPGPGQIGQDRSGKAYLSRICTHPLDWAMGQPGGLSGNCISYFSSAAI